MFPHNDTHFEDRSWSRYACDLRGIDDLTVVGTNNFIVTSHDVAISEAIFKTMAFDDIVKILPSRDL
jgi:hypothetical protein